MNLHAYWQSIPRKRWSAYAACGGMGATLFFANHMERAKAICARCPVSDDCLADALRVEPEENGMRHGVRGGMTPRERARFAELLRQAGVPLFTKAAA